MLKHSNAVGEQGPEEREPVEKWLARQQVHHEAGDAARLAHSPDISCVLSGETAAERRETAAHETSTRENGTTTAAEFGGMCDGGDDHQERQGLELGLLGGSGLGHGSSKDMAANSAFVYG